jgi:hypothetical protein
VIDTTDLLRTMNIPSGGYGRQGEVSEN